MADFASVTISTASSVNVTSDYQQIKVPGQGSYGEPQVARVLAMATASGTPSGTGYLRFVLRDKSDTAVGVLEATLTAHTGTPNRSLAAGSSGTYAMKVTFQNGTDLLDLLGATEDDRYTWWVGMASAFPTNVTAVTLTFPYSSVI